MIGSTSASFLFPTLSKDAAQPSTRVGIDGSKDIRFTVFKVLKPSSQGPAQILTNRTQAPPFCSPGLATNRVFEFVHAFPARPFHSPFKIIAQKVAPKLPCPSRVGVRFWASLTPRKLANASGRIVFNIVLFMDWQFVSGCLPPSLSTTQLPSTTDSQCSVRWGLPPHCWCALSGAHRDALPRVRRSMSRRSFLVPLRTRSCGIGAEALSHLATPDRAGARPSCRNGIALIKSAKPEAFSPGSSLYDPRNGSSPRLHRLTSLYFGQQ